MRDRERRSTRRRKHPVLKWSATVVAVVALAVMFVSFWFSPTFAAPYWKVGVECGSWYILLLDDPYLSWNLYVDRPRDWPKYVQEWTLWPNIEDRGFGIRLIRLPLWPVVALPVILAVWLWRLDRRPGPGHCQRCGYNLRGNVSGICPECGAAV